MTKIGWSAGFECGIMNHLFNSSRVLRYSWKLFLLGWSNLHSFPLKQDWGPFWLFGALVGYFWGQGRFQKTFWLLLIQTNFHFQSISLFLIPRLGASVPSFVGLSFCLSQFSTNVQNILQLNHTYSELHNDIALLVYVEIVTSIGIGFRVS